MLALKGEYMKRFGMLLFAVLLSTTSFAQSKIKELTCTLPGNGAVTQLTLNEDASTANWHMNAYTQPVPATFTETTVTFKVTSKGGRGETYTDHFQLYRMTGVMVQGGSLNWQCELSHQKY
jgi:hypothetical protein